MGRIRNIVHPIVRTLHHALAETLIFARLLESFDRPAWLYRSRGALPPVNIQFRPPRPVTDESVTVCQRLINAYLLAQAEAPKPSGMWSHEFFQDRQRELASVLRQGDAVRLAGLLASMFRLDFVAGMTLGNGGVSRSTFKAKIIRLHMLNKLVALAESLGAAHLENPEQGSVGSAFADGVEALAENIEAALGLSLDHPDVGAPYGILVAERMITWDSPDQIYASVRLREAMQMYLADRAPPIHVVEIGGGYGGMAYWLLQMTDVRYDLVDLPIINVLQGYFLTHALGPTVSFYGETPKRTTIMPTHALSSIELPFDLLVNKDSMPEIPESALLDYLRWARAGCNGIFYSYNQEAAAPFAGARQQVVPRALERVGGFTRIRRDASWLRRGYAEEIYRSPGSSEDTPADSAYADA